MLVNENSWNEVLRLISFLLVYVISVKGAQIISWGSLDPPAMAHHTLQLKTNKNGPVMMLKGEELHLGQDRSQEAKDVAPEGTHKAGSQASFTCVAGFGAQRVTDCHQSTSHREQW